MEKEGENTSLFEEVDFSDIGNEMLNAFSDLVEKPAEETTEETTEETREETQEQTTEETNEETQEETTEEEQQESSESETEDTSSSEDTDDNSSPLTPYAKLLVDEGILPNLDLEKFDGTGEGLINAMNDQITNGIESYKSQLPPEIKTFLENYEEGVPLASLLEIDSKKAEYKSIAADKIESDKDLQKALVTDFYKQTTRFSDEKINKMVQQMDDMDELKSEAELAHKGLVELQDEFEKAELTKAQETRKAQEAAREQQLTDFKKTLEDIQEIIPGYKLNPKSKEKIESILTTPVAQDNNGNLLNEISKYKAENPYKFDIMLAHLFETTKGFKDWSVLGSVGKKEAITELEKAAKKLDKSKSDKPVDTKKKSAKTTSEIVDALSKFNF